MRYLFSIFLMMFFGAFATSSWAVTYTYDDLNRLNEVILDNGHKLTYEYDEVGNITSRKGTSFTVSFTADPNGTLSGTTTQTPEYGGGTTAVTALPKNGYHFVNWTGTDPSPQPRRIRSTCL